VTVMRPDRMCTNSLSARLYRDGPGVHSQTPASWVPSPDHNVVPQVCIGSPVASSRGPQSSSLASAAAARNGS
jgi:hypothetical protein